MKFEWDEVKATANFAKHGACFEDVSEFEWELSVDSLDLRKDYRETRVISTSIIRGRPHVLVYSMRNDAVRLIRLRKANKRESISYEKAKKAKGAI